MPNIWPFIPQRGHTEETEWLTEVIKAKSGEQRMGLRNKPRTYLQFNYQLTPYDIEEARFLAKKYSSEDVFLPFWQESEQVGTVTSGSNTIQVDKTDKLFKLGGFAFIADLNSYEIVEITSTIFGGFNINGTVQNDYANAHIMPCYVAKVHRHFRINKRDADFVTASISFVLTEDFGLTPDNQYTQFNGHRVMTDRPVLAGSEVETNRLDFDVFDNSTGLLTYFKKYDEAVTSTSMSWVLQNRSQLHAFREWLLTVKGKLKPFYLPSWTRDFKLAVPIVFNELFIIIEKPKDSDFIYEGVITLVLIDGTLVHRSILSWVDLDNGQIQLNLNLNIGQNLDESDLEMISVTPLMRFNSDKVTYNHNTGLIKISIPVIEVPE